MGFGYLVLFGIFVGTLDRILLVGGVVSRLGLCVFGFEFVYLFTFYFWFFI